MSRIVLDASAWIALLLNERGAAVVAEQARGSVLSTVNLSEVFQRMLEDAVEPQIVTRQLSRFNVDVRPLTTRQAELAAGLRAATKPKGLALGDRVCLALALDLGLPALTGEQMWLEVLTGVDVRLFRERRR